MPVEAQAESTWPICRRRRAKSLVPPQTRKVAHPATSMVGRESARGQSRRAPIARRKMSSGSRSRVKRERHPLSREDRILTSDPSCDAIPQRADVLGDGLPVAEPGSVEVRCCEGFSDAGQRYARPTHRAGCPRSNRARSRACSGGAAGSGCHAPCPMGIEHRRCSGLCAKQQMDARARGRAWCSEPDDGAAWRIWTRADQP
jgi:hypothetical protein